MANASVFSSVNQSNFATTFDSILHTRKSIDCVRYAAGAQGTSDCDEMLIDCLSVPYGNYDATAHTYMNSANHNTWDRSTYRVSSGEVSSGVSAVL